MAAPGEEQDLYKDAGKVAGVSVMVVPVGFGDEITLIACSTLPSSVAWVATRFIWSFSAGSVKVQPPTAGSLAVFSLFCLCLEFSLSLCFVAELPQILCFLRDMNASYLSFESLMP